MTERQRELLIQKIVDSQVLDDFGVNALAPVGLRDEISKRRLLWDQHRGRSDGELERIYQEVRHDIS